MKCIFCPRHVIVSRLEFNGLEGQGGYIVCPECYKKLKRTNIFELMKEGDEND